MKPLKIFFYNKNNLINGMMKLSKDFLILKRLQKNCFLIKSKVDGKDN